MRSRPASGTPVHMTCGCRSIASRRRRAASPMGARCPGVASPAGVAASRRRVAITMHRTARRALLGISATGSSRAGARAPAGWQTQRSGFTSLLTSRCARAATTTSRPISCGRITRRQAGCGYDGGCSSTSGWRGRQRLLEAARGTRHRRASTTRRASKSPAGTRAHCCPAWKRRALTSTCWCARARLRPNECVAPQHTECFRYLAASDAQVRFLA
mmetsp:Transcript_2472/g.5216  ORF Transcript_2472/g.5216 Transcript_2472/m.5216 type:complete len:216 (+) Transcript_2472:1421-2068(+)